MIPERTLNSELVYKGRVISLRVDTVALPSGKTTKREIVDHRGCVVIVPVDAKGNVLLVRQFRKAIEKDLLEIPAGGMEPGEDPLESAKRELGEEAGVRAGKWERLAGFYSSPGFCNEYMHLYLATELRPGAFSKEADENIKVEPTPLASIPSLIESGDIQDAKSIAGLLLALRKLA